MNFKFSNDINIKYVPFQIVLFISTAESASSDTDNEGEDNENEENSPLLSKLGKTYFKFCDVCTVSVYIHNHCKGI